MRVDNTADNADNFAFRVKIDTGFLCLVTLIFDFLTLNKRFSRIHVGTYSVKFGDSSCIDSCSKDRQTNTQTLFNTLLRSTSVGDALVTTNENR